MIHQITLHYINTKICITNVRIYIYLSIYIYITISLHTYSISLCLDTPSIAFRHLRCCPSSRSSLFSFSWKVVGLSVPAATRPKQIKEDPQIQTHITAHPSIILLCYASHVCIYIYMCVCKYVYIIWIIWIK